MKKVINTSELLPPFEKLFNAQVLKELILHVKAQKLAKKIGGGEKLHIFIGSSGAGRDTILEESLKLLQGSVRIRRTTTRKPREYVVDQERMLFITEKKFLGDFSKGEILFAGRYKANQQLYGISKKEISKLTAGGKFHLLEENFSGLPVKMMLPRSKLVVVLPPSLEVLKERLFTRDKSTAECKKRLRTSVSEIKTVLNNLDQMLEQKLVDMVVVNDGSLEEVSRRVVDAIKRSQRLIDDFAKLTKSFLG